MQKSELDNFVQGWRDACELNRLRERVGELKSALEHVRASAQTGTYDGGVVISFAALEAVRNALAPLIAEAVKHAP